MVPTCSIGTLIPVLPHMNAMMQTKDMTPHPSKCIQKQDQTVVVLSMDVESHTGIHNYPF